MQYRQLCGTGLKLSVLGFGTWITFAEQGDLSNALELLKVARDAGVNFFDTADGYGSGRAEELLGAGLEKVFSDRASYVLSTKIYSGVRDVVNMSNTLNRKYLLCAIGESLDRLRTPFVDILFCHRPDPETPVEEVVWTMSDIVASGKACYWGTSEWPPDMIQNACQIAAHYRLRRPVVEQLEYNLIRRSKIESQYASLHRETNLGFTTWSPLASGLLTGKYNEALPAASRATLPNYTWLTKWLRDPGHLEEIRGFVSLAKSLDVPPAQLAIAWCTSNPWVSSVICGASSPIQLREDLAAVDVATRLQAGAPQRIARIFSGS